MMQKWICIALAALMLSASGCKKEEAKPDGGQEANTMVPSDVKHENTKAPTAVQNENAEMPSAAPNENESVPDAEEAPKKEAVEITEQEVMDFLKGDNPDLLEKLQ